MASLSITLNSVTRPSLTQNQALGANRPQSNNKILKPSISENSSDAVNVEVAAKRNASSAVSDAASRVNVANDAVSQIADLVSKAKSIAKEFETGTFKASERDAKAAEAETILTEIDNIVSNASFNGQSVLNSGSTSVTYDLSARNSSSADSISLTIPSVNVSTSDLGLSGLTADSFINDAENTRETLEDAELRLGSASNALGNNSSQLENFANLAGISASADAEAAKESNDGASPEELAARVAKAASSITSSIGAIDASRVDALLSEDSSNSDNSQKSDSAASESNSDSSSPSPEEIQRRLKDLEEARASS